MIKNVGTVDRAIRLGVAVAIIASYLLGYLSGGLAIVLGVVALALLATSLVSSCPAYSLLDLSTRKRN